MPPAIWVPVQVQYLCWGEFHWFPTSLADWGRAFNLTNNEDLVFVAAPHNPSHHFANLTSSSHLNHSARTLTKENVMPWLATIGTAGTLPGGIINVVCARVIPFGRLRVRTLAVALPQELELVDHHVIAEASLTTLSLVGPGLEPALDIDLL